MAGVSGRIVWAAAAALVAAACIAAAATPEAGSAARGKCEEQSGKTIAANEQVRALASNGLLYACAVRSRRLFVLGEYLDVCEGSGGCSGVGVLGLAGGYIAYAQRNQTRSASSIAIYVLDTKRARRLRVFREGSRDPSDPISLGGGVVTVRGGVAWMVSRDPGGTAGPRVTRVFKQNAGAGRELLDEGQGIELGSMAWSGQRLYWTNSGQPRSAPIK